MDRETSVVGKRSDPTVLDPAEAIGSSQRGGAVTVPPAKTAAKYAEVAAQADQLEARAKAALIRKLIPHLKTDQLQAIAEFAQREAIERQHSATNPAASGQRTTCLLLKKDYTYQDRGLSEPTQYYVYLRRRKPKLDRYIGTLFYVPQGCTLSYFPDAEGRILFSPPRNVFQLKDSKNSAVPQIVRLICLEPPPPSYTFAKQQDDVPEIYLRLEYLDPDTFQTRSEASYAFPLCMYEGGKLDRYRWEVSPATPPSTEFAPEIAPASLSPTPPASQFAPERDRSHQNTQITEAVQAASLSLETPKDGTSKPPRRVIELPPAVSTFYLANGSDEAAVLERMRLWAVWSEKAMPQSKWEIVPEKASYTLRNASFKRRILSFSGDRAAITLENSLPVLVKWFQDLCLAVSQTQNQKQYSSAQLKLARSLFVEMSLPQSNPLVVLKKLFGVQFVDRDGAARGK